MKSENFVVKIRSHISWIRERKHNGLTWLEGPVFTKHGAVSVYSQGDERTKNATRLDFVIGEKDYVRYIDKRYSKRGLITLAKRYAKEISELLTTGNHISLT